MTIIAASTPFPESYWVTPDLLMAGEYPIRYDELESRRRIQALIRLGLTNFIDLTHPNDCMPRYNLVLEDEANGYLKKASYSHFPIQDRSIPTVKQMIEILDEIDHRVSKKEPVYVHCIAGHGRTGTVVGCYLIRHGVEPQNFLQEIQKLRSLVPSRWARSPEADEQVEFVLAWKNGQ